MIKSIIIIILLFISILFIPFPVKVLFQIENYKYILSIYVFNINLNKKNRRGEAISKKRKSRKNLRTLKLVIHMLKNNKHKPTLKLHLDLNYGIEDAALNAICYGLLQILGSNSYRLAKDIFTIRTYKYNIIQHYNQNLLKLKVSSIIQLSLAQIIYVLIKIKI